MKMNCLELQTTLDLHEECVWDVKWHPSSKLLASCSADKSIRIWAKMTNQEWVCQHVISGDFSRTVRCLDWSPCGNYLAAASFDATVCVYKKTNNTPIHFSRLTTLEGHGNEVKAVSWSVSGRYLATCGRDKSVWVWETDDDEDFQCCSVIQPHSQDVKCVQWHPLEDVLASCSYDNTINIYKESYDSWETVATLKGHESTVWKIRFHPFGNLLASVSDDKTVRLWISKDASYTDWICAKRLSGLHDLTIMDCAWSVADNLTYLATVSSDNSLIILRIEYSRENHAIDQDIPYVVVHSAKNAHCADINCVSWIYATDSLLATACDLGLIKIWKFIPENTL